MKESITINELSHYAPYNLFVAENKESVYPIHRVMSIDFDEKEVVIGGGKIWTLESEFDWVLSLNTEQRVLINDTIIATR